jgi:hypothetical protein
MILWLRTSKCKLLEPMTAVLTFITSLWGFLEISLRI